MALFTEGEIRGAAQTRQTRLQKSLNSILTEAARTNSTSFDIFLSHSSNDREILVGFGEAFRSLHHSVYIDNVIDPHLSPEDVTADTAERLRVRMRQSRSLLYLHTDNSFESKWMPWELGFFDGCKQRVAILPVVDHEGELDFFGQEYLSVYPYVDVAYARDKSGPYLWVNRAWNIYTRFDFWLAQGEAAITEKRD